MAGFIKIYRSMFDHWIYADAEKFKAFIDLIQLARWKDEKLLLGNDLITVPRGSFYTSELKLAERWGWSRHKTRDFLKLLESDGMITKKGTSQGTMLTIENYSFYQDEGPTESTAKVQQKDNVGSARGQQKDTTRYTKEEGKEGIRNYKKDKKEKEETSPILTPLSSFPTPEHEKIFKQFGEVTYRTWFENVNIKNADGKITIAADNDFNKKIITERFGKKLKTILGKEIEVI